MKMKAYFLKNFPPVWTVYLFFFILVASYFFDLVIQSMACTSDVFVLASVRTGIICLAASVFGVWRIAAFYPYPSLKYAKSLALTPWHYAMQMPKGSVQLNITDIAIVAMLCLTTCFDKHISVMIPVIVFLYAYILTAIISTLNGIPMWKYWTKRIFILIIIPLAFYPLPSIANFLISLSACYLLCYIHLRDVLKGFPWNQTAWLEQDEDILTQKSLEYAETGWPHSSLTAINKNHFIMNKPFVVIIISFLVTWWLHAFLAHAYDIKFLHRVLSFILCYLAFFITVIRLKIYLLGTAPPISLLGRITNGYFIIPKYDHVLVAPVCIAITGFVTAYFLPTTPQYASWVFEGAIFVILCIFMGAGPNLNQWRNLGAFRIVRNKFQENKMHQMAGQGSGLNKPLIKLFTGK